jgi:hypothetical protein
MMNPIDVMQEKGRKWEQLCHQECRRWQLHCEIQSQEWHSHSWVMYGIGVLTGFVCAIIPIFMGR